MQITLNLPVTIEYKIIPEQHQTASQEFVPEHVELYDIHLPKHSDIADLLLQAHKEKLENAMIERLALELESYYIGG